MFRTKIKALAVLALLSWILWGCGSESGSSSEGGVAAGTRLELLSDGVEECTPLVREPNPDTESSHYDISKWDGWRPGAKGAVLGTLFDPGIGGVACIHRVGEILDEHIGLVNTFADQWSSSGSYSSGGLTASVKTAVSNFDVPFLKADTKMIILDRLVTVEDTSRDLTIHMAFAQSGSGNQTIIEQYSEGQGTAGVFISQIQGDKLRVWFAGVSEADDLKVQVMWEGDKSDDSFLISVCTDAGSGADWEAMGGGYAGSGGSDIALIARNNVARQLAEKYYVYLTVNDLERGSKKEIWLASETPPGTDGVLAYINEDMDGYPGLGFLGPNAYPEGVEDLAWTE
jgi:hypothetical protein